MTTAPLIGIAGSKNSGKTTLARALGEGIRAGEGAESSQPIAPFRRVQFTPDLLPSDITGTNVFDLEAQRFRFRPGPLFAHVVLADEINRTSPKVQAAMLEAMGEKQVTADNESHALDTLFFVIRDTKQNQRRAFLCLIIPFHRSNFCWLMFERIQTMQVTNKQLDWCHNRRHPHRH